MKEYVFDVEGMACAMCEAHINDAVRRVAGVKSVHSDRRARQTVVTAETLDTQAVMEAIAGLGYSPLGVREQEAKPSFWARLTGRKG